MSNYRDSYDSQESSRYGEREDCHTCTEREYCDRIHCQGYTYDM